MGVTLYQKTKQGGNSVVTPIFKIVIKKKENI